MDDLISVVVPIYNIAPYLRKCIASIRKQTYKNLEIILIDDGSTDGSEKICDEYIGVDSRIIVIHQKNGGLTVVRKKGIEIATGKYIGFVDGDDWIEKEMYERLYSLAIENACDIVTSCKYRNYSWGQGNNLLQDTIEEGKYEIKNDSSQYILCSIFSTNYEERIDGSICNKLFLTDTLKNSIHGIDEKIHGHFDDTVILAIAAMNSRNIYISREKLYHHREHEKSFTYAVNEQGLMQVNRAFLYLKKIFSAPEYSGKVYDEMGKCVAKTVIDAFNQMWKRKEYDIIKFLFKSDRIPNNSQIVIYGAGTVGKSYCRQFAAEKKYNVVAVVDQNAENISGFFRQIYKPEQLNKLDFDYIIIAHDKSKTVKKITEALKVIGVSEEKIIWEYPCDIFEYYN